jgi:hypothetical protein
VPGSPFAEVLVHPILEPSQRTFVPCNRNGDELPRRSADTVVQNSDSAWCVLTEKPAIGGYVVSRLVPARLAR